MSLNNRVKTFAVAMLLLDPCIYAHASLDDEMKGVFVDMINVTPAEGYKTARTLGVTGGSVVIRNPVVNTHLFTIVPPTWDLGCNGIDFHMGGFSMINMDQAIQAAKAILSNASTYAFKLALQGMCPSCESEMSKLAAEVNGWSKQFINSCTAGKQLLLATGPGAALQEWSDKNSAGQNAFARADNDIGINPDPFASLFGSPNPVSNLLNMANTDPDINSGPNVAKASIDQNSTWTALTTTNLAAGYLSGNSQDFREQLMSFTGTVVVKVDPTTGQATPRYVAPTLDLSQFLYGNVTLSDTNIVGSGTISILRCQPESPPSAADPSGTIQCLNPTAVSYSPGSFSITGVLPQVVSMVNSIAQKMYYRVTDSGATLYAPEEQQFLESTSPGITSILTSVGISSGASQATLDVMARNYALQVVTRWINETMNAMKQALGQSNFGASDKLMVENFNSRKKEIDEALAQENIELKSKIDVLTLAATVRANFKTLANK